MSSKKKSSSKLTKSPSADDVPPSVSRTSQSAARTSKSLTSLSQPTSRPPVAKSKEFTSPAHQSTKSKEFTSPAHLSAKSKSMPVTSTSKPSPIKSKADKVASTLKTSKPVGEKIDVKQVDDSLTVEILQSERILHSVAEENRSVVTLESVETSQDEESRIKETIKHLTTELETEISHTEKIPELTEAIQPLTEGLKDLVKTVKAVAEDSDTKETPKPVESLKAASESFDAKESLDSVGTTKPVIESQAEVTPKLVPTLQGAAEEPEKLKAAESSLAKETSEPVKTSEVSSETSVTKDTGESLKSAVESFEARETPKPVEKLKPATEDSELNDAPKPVETSKAKGEGFQVEETSDPVVVLKPKPVIESQTEETLKTTETGEMLSLESEDTPRNVAEDKVIEVPTVTVETSATATQIPETLESQPIEATGETSGLVLEPVQAGNSGASETDPSEYDDAQDGSSDLEKSTNLWVPLDYPFDVPEEAARKNLNLSELSYFDIALRIFMRYMQHPFQTTRILCGWVFIYVVFYIYYGYLATFVYVVPEIREKLRMTIGCYLELSDGVLLRLPEEAYGESQRTIEKVLKNSGWKKLTCKELVKLHLASIVVIAAILLNFYGMLDISYFTCIFLFCALYKLSSLF